MNIGLTIAGSDSSGGAGIQADIKAMQANGVYAASVLTAITAQNTQAVVSAYELPIDVIQAQIDAVCTDLHVDAVKTGMLSSAEIIAAVAGKVREHGLNRLVVDPVMVSKSGYALLKPEAIDALVKELLPLAMLVTPNALEAARLTGLEVRNEEQAYAAANKILEMGPRAVLIKGGHLEGGTEAVDILFDGKHHYRYTAPFIKSKHTHGTGCTYAASITANLAKGYTLREAIARSKRYVTDAIRHGLPIGYGQGPTDHFYFLHDSGLFPASDE